MIARKISNGFALSFKKSRGCHSLYLQWQCTPALFCEEPALTVTIWLHHCRKTVQAPKSRNNQTSTCKVKLCHIERYYFAIFEIPIIVVCSVVSGQGSNSAQPAQHCYLLTSKKKEAFQLVCHPIRPSFTPLLNKSLFFETSSIFRRREHRVAQSESELLLLRASLTPLLTNKLTQTLTHSQQESIILVSGQPSLLLIRPSLTSLLTQAAHPIHLSCHPP